ncbi:hypothetical protein G3O08_16240 [Cryomorpha ignava]|uniref:LTD domain-containing protein n=1 Tax=Cryomorpha ignava TaxID=101383 RepID=A0A7K3WVH6_9FLAO|nr:CotH kinase family protein [Cryomorpha ignava]NEN25051.1 hypothetical protein [Cryomorpha ignava]
MKTKILILAFFLGFISFESYAQVVINEVSAANFAGGGTVDNYGDYEDWIELYNTSATAFSLDGYFLSDNELEPMKWSIPAGVSVPANGYLLIYASGRGEFVGGNVHADFKITQAKQEGAVLSDAGGTIVDSYLLLTPNQTNHSRGRTTDGANTWSVFTTPTPGAANADARNEYPEVSIDTDPGYYTGSVSVTITGASALVDIHYTTNGSVPIAASPLYTGPIDISATTVLRARAISNDPNTPPGFVETNTYFVNNTHQIPIVSISGNQVEVLVNGTQIEPVGHFELFDKNGVLLAEAGGEYNEHGNDSWAYDQRGVDYITQDEFGYGNELDYPIFPSKDRNGYQRLILKAAASDNYPFEDGGAHIRDAYVQSLSQVADLRMDERTYEPCVMYVNGQYWGVYEIREKVDDLDFTDHYYDQGTGDVDFLKTWGGTWEEYGSADDWNDLRDYILANDMSDQTNYQYVKGLYNTGSLIDYFILNSYTVCSDWLNWNTGWWRGRNPDGDKKKWRYILWDMDATFGHYVNFTGIPDQSANADPCNPESLGNPGGQGHVPIWNALLTNEEFFADYINRYSDLSGNFFTCEFMHSHLDSLVALIEPEMPAHIARWGGNMAEWQQNVQDIHDFIEERCAVINDGFLDCYPELDGPYEITLMADPPEGGIIQTSSMDISDFPFTATYFGGINAPFDADENDGFTFSHWTSNGTAFTPDELNEEIVVTFTANDTLVAHFVPDVEYTLSLNVAPPNSGTITLNGTLYDTFPATVTIAGGALNEASGQAIDGWGFENWTADFVLNGTSNSNPVEFSLDENGTLTAHFFEIIYDVTFDVSPPDVAQIKVGDETLEELEQTLVLQGNTPIKISTAPIKEFYEFSHWYTLSAVPDPDENTANVEMTFSGPDLVIANYVELPNYPLIIDTEPRNVGWVKLPDTIVTAFPYQRQQLGHKKFIIEAIDRGKYAFDRWEVVYGFPITDEDVPYQNYTMASSTKLVAHFKERLHAVWVPTSFTPNGDGVNDLFKAYAREIDVDDFRLSIMSRWGQEMFYTEDITKGWNGSKDGGGYYAPPGIYAYFIRYVDTVTKEITEKAGTIVLVR